VEEKEMDYEQVLDELRKLWPIDEKPTLIVISGGEPMLQQRDLEDLIGILIAMGNEVEIETAGTITPIDSYRPGTEIGDRVYDYVVYSIFSTRDIHYNVSPKLAHSGNNLIARRNGDALWKLAELNSNFKFVVASLDDLKEVELLVEIAGIPGDRVWCMPEGVTTQQIKEHGLVIVDEVLKRGWNLSLRNHIWLWEEERGK
jgi:organic radical activating enzyme